MAVEGLVGPVGSGIPDRNTHHLDDLGILAVLLKLADIRTCQGREEKTHIEHEVGNGGKEESTRNEIK